MGIRKLVSERLGSDEGLSLIECVIALVIFSIAAGGLAFTLQAAGHTSANNRLRVQAANLAARELEIDRNEFNASAAGPVTLGAIGTVTNPHNLLSTATPGSPLVIDNVPFTVVRDVQWLPTGTGESPCDGGALVTYPSLKVVTSVTWAKMGSTKPVVNSTLLTPPKSVVSTTTGFIAVKVTGATGNGIDNLPVIFSKGSTVQTRLTESDGCAVFSTTDYGTWTAKLDSPGYVTTDLALTRSATTTVASGTLSQLPLSYEKSATVRATQATITTTPTYQLPSPLPPLTFYNTGLPAPDVVKFTSGIGTTTTIGGLWPYTDGYSVWAGSCDQSTPATRPAGVPLTAGGTFDQTVKLAPVDIYVRNRNITNTGWVVTPNVTVIATPQVLTGCAASDTLKLGITDATGLLRTSLPSGAYVISVQGRLLQPTFSWPVSPANLSQTTPTAINTPSTAISLAFL
jgi:prepilin-type N-terminal cleavage/methylation domain-containing protein